MDRSGCRRVTWFEPAASVNGVHRISTTGSRSLWFAQPRAIDEAEDAVAPVRLVIESAPGEQPLGGRQGVETLVEVPIAKLFLEEGMAKGPLLAYLLADPVLSIQSILVTSKIIGKKKNSLFVLLTAIFSIIAGLIIGLILGEGISVV